MTFRDTCREIVYFIIILIYEQLWVWFNYCWFSQVKICRACLCMYASDGPCLTVLVRLLDGPRGGRGLAGAELVGGEHPELVGLPVQQIENGITGRLNFDTSVDARPFLRAR